MPISRGCGSSFEVTIKTNDSIFLSLIFWKQLVWNGTNHIPSIKLQNHGLKPQNHFSQMFIQIRTFTQKNHVGNYLHLELEERATHSPVSTKTKVKIANNNTLDKFLLSMKSAFMKSSQNVLCPSKDKKKSSFWSSY